MVFTFRGPRAPVRSNDFHTGAFFSRSLDRALPERELALVVMAPDARRSALLALAGAVEPVLVLGGSVLFGSWRSGYEVGHAISELGQQGSTNAVAWNVVGFGGAALLYALFAVAIGAGLGRGWLFRVSAVQAVAIAAGGTFSCDPGCPPVMSSWQGWAHTVSGLTYFALTCIVPLVGWRTFRRRTEWRSLAPVSLAAGVVLVGLFLAGPILFGGPELVGYWQRLTLVIAGGWSVAVALRLFRYLGSPGEANEPLTHAGAEEAQRRERARSTGSAQGS